VQGITVSGILLAVSSLSTSVQQHALHQWFAKVTTDSSYIGKETDSTEHLSEQRHMVVRLQKLGGFRL